MRNVYPTCSFSVIVCSNDNAFLVAHCISVGRCESGEAPLYEYLYISPRLTSEHAVGTLPTVMSTRWGLDHPNKLTLDPKEISP